MNRIKESKLKIKFKDSKVKKIVFIAHTARTITVELFFNHYTL